MSYFNTFHGFHQPYFSFNLVHYGTNPVYETATFNQKLNSVNNYIPINEFFYQNFDTQTSKSEPKCANSRLTSLKNSAQNYIK